MFSNVSWQEYWTSIILITLGYYLVIYLRYFKKSLQLSSQARLHSDTSAKEESQSTLFEIDNPDITQTMKESEEPIIEACMDELNAFFENAKKTKAVKSELMFNLYTILQKYPSLKNSDYKESLTNLIATQCENICSIHLSAEELKGVWFG